MASVRTEEGAMEVHNRRSDHLKNALGLGSGRQDSRKRESHKQGSRGKREDNTGKKMRKILGFPGLWVRRWYWEREEVMGRRCGWGGTVEGLVKG